MKSLSVLCLVSLAVTFGCGRSKDGLVSQVKEAWDNRNDPLNLSGNYLRKLGQLPASASSQVKPWSDTYWPSQKGGVAFRWRTGQVPWEFSAPSESMVRSMSQSDIAVLSPAEKYDIFMGRFDYPTVQGELGRTGPSRAAWEGLCHGWAPASYLYSEPQARTLRGPSGISVPFGSSDVKALLTYQQALYSRGQMLSLGGRCNDDLVKNPGLGTSPQCRDVNAGAFHVVLTNQIGLLRQPFIADVTRDLEVWNNPVYAYASRQIGENARPSAGAAPGTVREVRYETTMDYTNEIEPNWNAVLGTSAQANVRRAYSYRLELNNAGDIIGGEWESADRPDFLWLQLPSSMPGGFEGVEAIYKGSIDRNPIPLPTPDPRPTPIPDIGYFCPAGYDLKSVGTVGGNFCSDGREVPGAFPQQMIEKCQSFGGGNACFTSRWSLRVFLSSRGIERCPKGTNWDASLNSCNDGNGSVFGPFTNEMVSLCQNSNDTDVNCNDQAWPAAFARRLLRR